VVGKNKKKGTGVQQDAGAKMQWQPISWRKNGAKKQECVTGGHRKSRGEKDIVQQRDKRTAKKLDRGGIEQECAETDTSRREGKIIK